MADFIPDLHEAAEEFCRLIANTHLHCAVVYEQGKLDLLLEGSDEWKKLMKDETRMCSSCAGIYWSTTLKADELYEDLVEML